MDSVNSDTIHNERRHYCNNQVCYEQHFMDQVECPTKENDRGPQIDSNNPYYSNQGDACTCVRHALAKAILYFVNNLTENRIPLDVNSLVLALLNARQDFGSKGAYPTDWDAKTITVSESQGQIFDLTLDIKEQRKEDMKQGSVVCIDLRKHIEELKGEVKAQLHAMFAVSQEKETLTLVNSWGEKYQYITVNKESTIYLRGYSVQVKDLIWRNYKIGDIAIIKNAALVQNEVWQKRWNINLEEKRRKQTNRTQHGIYCKVCRKGFRHYEETVLTKIFGLQYNKYYCNVCKQDQPFEYRLLPKKDPIKPGIYCKNCGKGYRQYERTLLTRIFGLQKSLYYCSDCNKNTPYEYRE